MYCDYCRNEIKPSKARYNTGGRFSVAVDTISMPFICKRCGGSFCSKHRLPENHDCVGLKAPIIIDLKNIDIAQSIGDQENNADTKEYTLNELEKIRRIKTSMLNDSQGKNKRTRLLNELFRLDEEIDIIKESLDIKKESTPVSENKTNHICQFCFKSIEHSQKCQKCGLELCQDHIFNHSCIKALVVEDDFKKEKIYTKTQTKRKTIKKKRKIGRYYSWKHPLKKIYYTPLDAIKDIPAIIFKKNLLFLILIIFGFIAFNNLAINEQFNFLGENSTIENIGGSFHDFVLEEPEPISNETKDIEKSIFKYTNDQRKKRVLNELIRDEKLADIAREHSLDMAMNDFFDHINLMGEDPTDRATRHQYPIKKYLSGRTYSIGIAENIGSMPTGNVEGIGYVYSDVDSIGKALVDSWMASPGHRENILNPKYDVIGVGVAFDGQYYVSTQNFK